jgi:hypothetical protein
MQSSQKIRDLPTPGNRAAKLACFTLPARPLPGFFPRLRSSMRKRVILESCASLPITKAAKKFVPRVVATCGRVEWKIARARGFICDRVRCKIGSLVSKPWSPDCLGQPARPSLLAAWRPPDRARSHVLCYLEPQIEHNEG